MQILVLFDADARIEQIERQTLGLTLRNRIGTAIEDYRRERSTKYLQLQALHAAAATTMLMIIIMVAMWFSRRFGQQLEQFFSHRIHNVGIQSFEIVRAESVWFALRGTLSLLRILAFFAVVFAYLEFVLRDFPWTRSFASELGSVVLRPLKIMVEGLVDYIPDLVFLVTLVLVIRFCLRLMRLFFDAVARGSVTFKSFEADWAWPTYKIARFAILAFAVIIAYPYIPGSGSSAFKGVSLLLGVIISLGSSSAIANVIAGIMITYRRAFKVGDRVTIGNITGDVTEVRLQESHLRTLKNEEVTIPNSTIMTGSVMNLSTLAARHGLILHTSVGIGYETPWRQVEAILLMAVARTPGLLTDPPPFVLHTTLGDFCITYEINAYCNDAKAMQKLLTELSRNILDLFNEFGVQIMTPAYEGDPETQKLVPKEQWYSAPALSENSNGPGIARTN